MESDQRYYWRRASEELHAAARAVTPAARSRRRALAESYLDRLKELVRDRPEGPELNRRIAALAAMDQAVPSLEACERPLAESVA